MSYINRTIILLIALANFAFAHGQNVLTYFMETLSL